MDRLTIKNRISLNSSPLHSTGSIFPTVLEEPNLSFSDDKDSTTQLDDAYNDAYNNQENGRQTSGKHKSRRRLPTLTSAFRKHCSRSFDSGISYLLTETTGSHSMDDVLNEEEVGGGVEQSSHELSQLSPRHQPWSPSKSLHQQRIALEPPTFETRNSFLSKKPLQASFGSGKKQPNTTLISRYGFTLHTTYVQLTLEQNIRNHTLKSKSFQIAF
jgi:hypothetical protein